VTDNNVFDSVLVASTGLKPKHIAHLFGVSRFTATSWLNGSRQPHRYLADEVLSFMAGIREAVAAKELPIADDDDKLPEEIAAEMLQTARRYWDKHKNA
jgi:hypothetical protein